ncbi:MAG: diaminopimelate epimerase [Muribaculaceae bacterium]|nr:diaminopimelate epimerase [Muribaculaceae bacterium]
MPTIEEIEFVKMHGAGNDYVYIDATQSCPEDLPALARAISDRHFGVGGDGLVAILRSECADFRMRMFNADGSEAQMCGNASRCIGKFVYDRGLTASTTVTLETLAGIKILRLHLGDDGKVATVTVDMGEPTLEPVNVPAIASSLHESGAGIVELAYGDRAYRAVAVSMGNPHGVIFIDHSPTDHEVLEIGKAFEVDPAWPEKVNVEFACVISPERIEMRVWERGSGETLACGTGACATAVAAALTGRASRHCDIILRGGTLTIEWDEATGHVFMTGPAATVADGRYYYSPTSPAGSPSCRPGSEAGAPDGFTAAAPTDSATPASSQPQPI